MDTVMHWRDNGGQRRSWCTPSLSLPVSEAASVLWSSLSVRFDHHHPTATDSAQLSSADGSLEHAHMHTCSHCARGYCAQCLTPLNKCLLFVCACVSVCVRTCAFAFCLPLHPWLRVCLCTSLCVHARQQQSYETHPERSSQLLHHCLSH